MNNNEVQDDDDNKTLDDIDISYLLLIKNPNNEVAIGCSDIKPNNDQLETSSEKYVTHLHYGTIEIQNPRNLYLRRFTVSEIMEMRINSFILRYMVLILSLLLITLDLKTVRNRIYAQDAIVAELRMIHIQLDDSQLYQIFWSFLIVYIIILLMYSVFVIMSVIYDSLSILKTTFRLLMFTLLYQLIEIVLRKYNLMIIVIRLILIFLVKAWKSLNYQIVVALQLQPELRLQVLGGILGRSR